MRRKRDVDAIRPRGVRPVQIAHLDVRAARLADAFLEDGAHRLRRLDGDHTGDTLTQRQREPPATSANVEPCVARLDVR